MATTELKDLAEEKWEKTIAAYTRAVEWIKQHKEMLLRGFSYYVYPDSRYGAEIYLGNLYVSAGDHAEKRKLLRQVFSGKSVKRTRNKCQNEDRYVLEDDETQLTFRWTISRPKDRCTTEETEIVF